MTVFSSPTERTMEQITRVGIDLGKKVFHVTAVDAAGAVVERRRLRRAGLRSYLALLPRGRAVAMEACRSASHWGRLAAWHGHRPLPMSPQHVAPYVKSNKNDANDADAIAEASARPTMRFVGVKTVRQQHIQQAHRAQRLAVKQRTAQGNQIHGFLLEYGIESPKGVGALLRRLEDVLEDAENELPVEGRTPLPGAGRRIPAPARARRGVRRAAPGDQSRGAGVPAAGGDPGRRPADVDGAGGGGRGRGGVPQRPGAGDLARHRAAAALDRREADAARHQQARRSVSAHAADPRRPRGVAGGAPAGGPPRPMGGRRGGASRRWRWRTRTREQRGRCWRATHRSTRTTRGRRRDGNAPEAARLMRRMCGGTHRGPGAEQLPTRGRIYVCNRIHLARHESSTVANAGRTICVFCPRGRTCLLHHKRRLCFRSRARPRGQNPARLCGPW